MSYDTLAANAIPAGSLTAPAPNLVLFDGLCPMCHGLVRFLLRVDRRRVLAFAPLQGATAQRVAERQEIPQDLRTMVYVRDFGLAAERTFLRSEAVLRCLADVGGLWWVVSLVRVVPRPLRDALYDFVARRRTRWFGRHDSCPLPPREHRNRFLP